MTSRLRHFTRINPPILFRSKLNEDPQEFLDEFYKILYSIEVGFNGKAKIASYQLKDVAQTSYTQRTDNSALRMGPITWEVFRRAFLIVYSQGIKGR